MWLRVVGIGVRLLMTIKEGHQERTTSGALLCELDWEDTYLTDQPRVYQSEAEEKTGHAMQHVPLQRAFESASQLPAGEQDAIASWLLAELESEKKWATAFSSSQSELETLAKRALAEHSRGDTTDL